MKSISGSVRIVPGDLSREQLSALIDLELSALKKSLLWQIDIDRGIPEEEATKVWKES